MAEVRPNEMKVVVSDWIWDENLWPFFESLGWVAGWEPDRDLVDAVGRSLITLTRGEPEPIEIIDITGSSTWRAGIPPVLPGLVLRCELQQGAGSQVIAVKLSALSDAPPEAAAVLLVLVGMCNSYRISDG